MTDYPLTVKAALADWDSGKPVATVEMGGISTEYEHAIQNLVFEILRDYADAPPTVETLKDTKYYESFGAAAIKRCAATYEYSYAQVAVAKNLAGNYLYRGYQEAILSLPRYSRDASPARIIQVTKGV